MKFVGLSKVMVEINNRVSYPLNKLVKGTRVILCFLNQVVRRIKMASITVLVTVGMALVTIAFSLLVATIDRDIPEMYFVSGALFLVGFWLWMRAIEQSRQQDNLDRQDRQKMINKLNKIIELLGKK